MPWFFNQATASASTSLRVAWNWIDIDAMVSARMARNRSKVRQGRSDHLDLERAFRRREFIRKVVVTL